MCAKTLIFLISRLHPSDGRRIRGFRRRPEKIPIAGIGTSYRREVNGRAVKVWDWVGLTLRLYERRRLVESGDDEWTEQIARFPEYPGVRPVIVTDKEVIADSCGFAVLLYGFKGDRSRFVDYAVKKDPEGVTQYRAQKNLVSIDGLAGLRAIERSPES
jgi:hypothetical protein